MSEEKKALNVGLVMPIAPIDGCSSEHWIDVKRIITESLSNIPKYQCDPKIVSEGNSVGLIHKRIVEGLYKSDIVICDVSCKNPNVMFELGMRLAFDKPTVIIKDDRTDYSFDTGVIEHLQYPRDLRYRDIVDFKELLAEKVFATYEDSTKDPDHSPFLKSFGTFKVASLNETIVSSDRFIFESLRDMQNDIEEIKINSNKKNSQGRQSIDVKSQLILKQLISKSIVEYLTNKISTNEEIKFKDTFLAVANEIDKLGFSVQDCSNLITQEIAQYFVDNDIRHAY